MKLLQRFLFGGRDEYCFINSQKVSPRIVIEGLAFALIMGLTGRAAAGLPGGTDVHRGGLAGGLMPKRASHSVMD